MTDEFEQAFGNYLEQSAYDDAEESLFSMIRSAFIAGWKAAGGNEREVSNVVQFVRRDARWTLKKKQ